MAASLSAYWVKFFKGAGFPQDLATKHALVFSNNRIKPDMLPDLDKSSLKDMGIMLMGDMIAILRYAKKVVEETTCERFLVDSEDIPSASKISAQPVMKKVAKEVVKKTAVLPATVKPESAKKVIKPLSAATKKIITIKKPTSSSNVLTNVEYISQKKQLPIKRKLVSDEIYESNEEDWSITEKKKMKASTSDNDEDDCVEYKVAVSKTPSMKTQQIIKKPVEQKRTVFDRLGDSSVTSTTNLADTSPTFNITGINNKDVFKRSVSVFRRLGEIDSKKDCTSTAGILKNGSSNSVSVAPGILKNRSPDARTTIITTKRIATKTTGTMHADHEVGKKIVLNNTKRILKVERKPILSSDTISSEKRITKITMAPGKLASERLVSIPAKARLGSTTPKQVTFSKVATVTHVKKADVFSRLGI
ncbi:uncharacterized protein C19orf47 [Odontomachus brunneus]|uniref:uncharacterized protein C19orf47 n=1 Tax=Odontomachus brunneus TaxID=486640 RepID=UPI0013F1F322|nr:uncharacterized protein C19orf47 [Odontomachus brunneus]XP_032690917.1 uncharacterized protein C19orf47 [Odontomachus brunneus]XP_032690918.1 uncharacterized protein C19orf47 [Odontomachus brunneus]XP_032690919.1 uncharacterized protein C19orf47 [Odontomachus brunneus]